MQTKIKEKRIEREEQPIQHLSLRNYDLDFLVDYPRDNTLVIKPIKTKKLKEYSIVDGKKKYLYKMSAIVDPFFKALFLHNERLDYSAKLFSLFLDCSYEYLRDNLKFEKNIFNKEEYNDKENEGDYVSKVKDSYLSIEVNNSSHDWVTKRNMLYSFKLMNRSNKTGVSGRDATRIQSIMISINNYGRKGIDDVVRLVTYRDNKNIVYSDSPITFEIFLSNIRKKVYTYNERGNPVFDESKIKDLDYFEKLMLIAIEQDVEICEKIGKGDEFLERFLDDAIRISRDEDLLQSYDKSEADRELAREEGADKKSREVAEIMLKDNEPIDKIIKYSNLSENEIGEIKENLKV